MSILRKIQYTTQKCRKSALKIQKLTIFAEVLFKNQKMLYRIYSHNTQCKIKIVKYHGEILYINTMYMGKLTFLKRSLIQIFFNFFPKIENSPVELFLTKNTPYARENVNKNLFFIIFLTSRIFLKIFRF